MKKFLFLIREDLKVRSALTPEEFLHNCKMVSQWIDTMARTGNYLQADGLTGDGRYIGRNYMLTDGPFIEAKESISGFILIQAEDMDRAAALGRTCPLIDMGFAVVEVRPIMDVPEF
jgi:hypothetical protein